MKHDEKGEVILLEKLKGVKVVGIDLVDTDDFREKPEKDTYIIQRIEFEGGIVLGLYGSGQIDNASVYCIIEKKSKFYHPSILLHLKETESA